MESVEYRKSGLSNRAEMSLGERSLASMKIAKNVLSTLNNDQTIFCYLSYQHEVATFALIQDFLGKGGRVAIPWTNYHTKEMKPILVDKETIGRSLVKDIYGIHEPDEAFARAHLLDPAELDVVLCPGTAFSRDGGRMGYGGGFYDRFLATKNIYKIGLCFDCQLFPHFEQKKTDVPMDMVITDNEIIKLK